jgi:hypothetical protein
MRRCRLLRSLSGVKRTCRFAPHMSANDPKRTVQSARSQIGTRDMRQSGLFNASGQMRLTISSPMLCVSRHFSQVLRRY